MKTMYLIFGIALLSFQIWGETVSITLIADSRDEELREMGELVENGLKSADSGLSAIVSRHDIQEIEANPDLVPGEIDRGSDFIIGTGFTLETSIESFASSHPMAKFIGIGMYPWNEIENLVSIGFRLEEGFFLAGFVAGKMSKTGKIGFIGGMDIEPISSYRLSFEKGARYANPRIVVLGAFIRSFNDPETGQELARKMYDAGADIIAHSAGPASSGIMEAAIALNRYVIGSGFDQSRSAPRNLLFSVVARPDRAVIKVLKDSNEGEYHGGKIQLLGVADNFVEIALNTNGHVPGEVIAETERIRQEIVQGNFDFPNPWRDYANTVYVQ